MKSYKVLQPTGFMMDGKAASAWAGAVVELDAATAKELGDKVEAVEADADASPPAKPLKGE